MSERDFVKELNEAFPGTEVNKTGERRYWLAVPPEQLHEAVQKLKDRLGLGHLSTIVGEDLRDAFHLDYIFSGPVVVILQVKISRENPEVPSLAQLVPGSLVYERENYDLFGITPVGHPDLRRQVVPEDWPEGLFPLRKDVKLPRAEYRKQEN